MRRVLESARRVAGFSLAAFVFAAGAPGAALAYWDFQGTLHDYADVPYEYGETNPSSEWGIRLSRSNCEAKMIFRFRSDGSLYVFNIPGGCSTLDYSFYYPGSTLDKSMARNTDTGPGDVWANVRIDATL